MPRKKQKKVPEGYRSNFEYEIAQKLQPSGFTYEPHQIEYVVHRKYTPDFFIKTGGTEWLIEAKGFFRAGDTQKYTSINDSLGEHQMLAFVLMKPNQKVSKTTKLTMSQWCDKWGIPWYTIDTLEELINDVSNA